MSIWVPKKRKKKKKIVEASAKKANNVIKKIGLVFGGSDTGRDTFDPPEGFDFEEIEKAYLTDSYIRTAIDKYIDFMFKAGWDLVGKNPQTVEYIKQRLASIAVATNEPIDQLWIGIAEELVKYHNAFIVKARQPNSYAFPPGLRVAPINGQKKPVVGYFLLPTNTITIARDLNGTIKGYQQEVSGGDPLVIKPTDMIHIHVDKQPGRAFGFPFLWEVLDDVKLLRQMEELVDRMVYKNIFPLMVYQVGLAQDGMISSDEEIEEVKEMLGELELDGGLVLPERHNLKTIGAEGKALDVNQYLTYFENRVFTGLGVSSTIMGRGDTANKSTSDNMDAAFRDRIKAYQKVMSTFVNHFIVNELLQEGGYDPILNEDQAVEFIFREIDFDSKIKKENHAIQKFTQNAITYEELRMELGMDASVDENRLYFNMVTASIASQSERENQTAAANNAGTNKNKPANQHGTKLSPKKEKISESLSSNAENSNLAKELNTRWDLLRIDTIEYLKKFYSNSENKDEKLDIDGLKINFVASSKGILASAKRQLDSAFIQGAREVGELTGSYLNISYDMSMEQIVNETNKLLDRLIMSDLMIKLEKALESGKSDQLVLSTNKAFDSLQYRLRFIANTQISKSYNFGFAKAARELGYQEVYIEASFDSNDECATHSEKKINLLTDKLPPFHTNCTCKLTLRSRKEDED